MVACPVYFVQRTKEALLRGRDISNQEYISSVTHCLPFHLLINYVFCLMISVNTSPTITENNWLKYKTLDTSSLKCARTM